MVSTRKQAATHGALVIWRDLAQDRVVPAEYALVRPRSTTRYFSETIPEAAV